MTDSETLRAMLKERGIKYETRDALDACETSWCGYTAYQLTPESKLIMHPTPEEAIAATMGVGTCELINAADDLGKGTSSFMCFECGYTALDYWWDEFNYCPQCGARIIKETIE